MEKYRAQAEDFVQKALAIGRDVVAEVKNAPLWGVGIAAALVYFVFVLLVPLVLHIFGDNAFGPFMSAVFSFAAGVLTTFGYGVTFALLGLAGWGWLERSKKAK